MSDRIAGVPRKIVWRIFAAVSGLVTTLAVTKGMSALWQRSTGKPVPDNPFDRRTSWKEAMSWAIALGAGASVARVVTNRTTAAAWEKATGDPPPGVAH
jgi:hypothetical protein